MHVCCSAGTGICRMSYEDRKKYSRNKTGRKLLEIIARKKSNLAVAATDKN